MTEDQVIQRAILWMQCDILSADDNLELDPEFVQKMLAENRIWALAMKLQLDYTQPPEVAFVMDILDMWCVLDLSGSTKKFPGFDGSDGSGHYQIAETMVNHLKNWDYLEGRSLNCNGNTTVDEHQKQLKIYKQIPSDEIIDHRLNTNQIRTILNA